jgi:hypothetical protein
MCGSQKTSLNVFGPGLGPVGGVERQVPEKQRVPHRVPREHVVPVADEDRGHVAERGEHRPDAGADPFLPGPRSGSGVRRRAGRVSQRVQVSGLVGVQPQRPGDGVEHAV